MKISTKLSLALAVVLSMTSCFKHERSSASVNQNVNFEMNELAYEKYFQDSLMYTTKFSLDDVIVFNTACDNLNRGFIGGFKVSTLFGGKETSDEMARYASADPRQGMSGSMFYMTFNQAPFMSGYDIEYILDNYYSAETQILGCCVCNTLYNSRLAEQGLIEPGDYLKVTFEFFNGDTSVGSISKYLIDYTGAELKMINEWKEWDMAGELQAEKAYIASFDKTKIRFEIQGSFIEPCFCFDDYLVHISVTY